MFWDWTIMLAQQILAGILFFDKTRQWNLLYYLVGKTKQKPVQKKQRSSFAFNKETNINVLKEGLLIHVWTPRLADSLLSWARPQPSLQPIDCNILIELTFTASPSLFASLHGLSPGSDSSPLTWPFATGQANAVWFSSSGLQTSRIITTWGLVRDANSQAPLQRLWVWSPAMADLTSPTSGSDAH